MLSRHYLFTLTLAGLLSPLMASVTHAQPVPPGPEPRPSYDEAADASELTPIAAAMQAVSAAYSEMTGGQKEAVGGCECGKSDCGTCEKQKALKKAAATAYKDVFYNNDFAYLSDPCYNDWHLGEHFKRMCFADWAVVDVGGQYRLREMTERGIRATAAVPNLFGLTGADDDFLLQRTRLYVNAQLGSRVRFYGEMLDATSNFEDYKSRLIEDNRTEMQNMFLDYVVLDPEAWGGKLTARVGRQELLYGAQRLVSPLDWANTRRTFDGAKLMWEGENWDVDALWVRPMRRYIKALDPPDLDRQLYGLYSTYKGWQRDKADLYWLAYDNEILGFRYDTLGSRYYGNYDAWLYELEGGVQFGLNGNDTDHSAGFFTLGGGRKFDCVRWKPTLWAYFDWASGDGTYDADLGPKVKSVGTGFNHYEPLAHKYLGYMDLYGRRNIETINFQLTMTPHEKLTLLAWYYYFWLQTGKDVPYDVDMTPFAGLSGGQAGSRDLGHEIDLTATYAFTARLSALMGYSHFFSGRFYSTSPVPYDGDANFFYTQVTLNF
jgi:hypothetical protein